MELAIAHRFDEASSYFIAFVFTHLDFVFEFDKLLVIIGGLFAH